MDAVKARISLLMPEHQKLTEGKNKRAKSTLLRLNFSTLCSLVANNQDDQNDNEAITKVADQNPFHVIIAKTEMIFVAIQASSSRQIQPGG